MKDKHEETARQSEHAEDSFEHRARSGALGALQQLYQQRRDLDAGLVDLLGPDHATDARTARTAARIAAFRAALGRR